MARGRFWSGAADGSAETIFAGTTFLTTVSAPTLDFWTLERLDLNISLRAHLTSTPGVPENWWVSSEVYVDAVFAEDGVDFTPDITSSDERILYSTKLQPRISYTPTAAHYSIVWSLEETNIQTKGRRLARVLGSANPAVMLHLSAIDQHGVFNNGGSATNRLFARDSIARALWLSPA